MGKMVSLYLTDREAGDLRRFCEEHSCTQYSALKTALRELMSQHIGGKEQEISDDKSKTNQQANTVNADETETTKKEKADDKPISRLTRYLEKRR